MIAMNVFSFWTGVLLALTTTSASVAALGVPIKALLSLNETQFGLLVATPVLTGSLIRLPLGMLTDKLGGRIVFFVLMMVCVLPIYFISEYSFRGSWRLWRVQMAPCLLIQVKVQYRHSPSVR
jgi:nitrate/nitrite transporter NarK